MEFPHPFGDYTLLEPIATGGMAEVYRAQAGGFAGFEKIVVIKRVLDTLAQDPDFVEMFVNEARIAAELHHVNIVQVFELGKVGDTHFMALESVDGLDLAELVTEGISRGPFPIPLALFVVTEVLKALAYAHSRSASSGEPMRIVHCDMSPQNILISQAGEVKITDFGISRAAFQARAVQDVIRGKYAYMSPEQVDGKSLDARSDLFSLGVVLFELLTGRRLFKREDRDATMKAVRAGEVPPLQAYRPEIPASLGVFVRTALNPVRSERYQTAEEMLEVLGQIRMAEDFSSTNHDLSSYVKRVREGDHTVGQSAVDTRGVLVLSVSIAVATDVDCAEEMRRLASEASGEVWESAGHTMLVSWKDDELSPAMKKALGLMVKLHRLGAQYHAKMACGLAPGLTQLDKETGRPPEGWELEGPFYLARWMMALSASRGRPVLTRVAARMLPPEVGVAPLGNISVLGAKSLRLYEIRPSR